LIVWWASADLARQMIGVVIGPAEPELRDIGWRVRCDDFQRRLQVCFGSDAEDDDRRDGLDPVVVGWDGVW